MSPLDVATGDAFTLCLDAGAVRSAILIESLRSAARVHHYLCGGSTSKRLEFAGVPSWDLLAAALLARIVGRASLYRGSELELQILMRPSAISSGGPAMGWPQTLRAAGLRDGEQEMYPLLHRTLPLLDTRYLKEFRPPGHAPSFAKLVEKEAGPGLQASDPGRYFMLQRIGPRLFLDAVALGAGYSGPRRLTGRTQGVPRDTKTLACVCRVRQGDQSKLAVMTLTDGPTLGELVPGGDPTCRDPDVTAKLLFSQNQRGEKVGEYGLLSSSIGAALPANSLLTVASGCTVLEFSRGTRKATLLSAQAWAPRKVEADAGLEDVLEGILTCLLVDLPGVPSKVPVGSEPITGGAP